MSKVKDMQYYDRLGVPPECTASELKKSLLQTRSKISSGQKSRRQRSRGKI